MYEKSPSSGTNTVLNIYHFSTIESNSIQVKFAILCTTHIRTTVSFVFTKWVEEAINNHILQLFFEIDEDGTTWLGDVLRDWEG